MRTASLVALALALVLGACGDDEGNESDATGGKAGKGGKGGSGEVRAGTGGKGGSGGVGGGQSKPSALERHGTLPRPPKTGLPDDLRPPR